MLGTSVVSGTATALVLATGPRTVSGDIATRLQTRAPETEFDRGIKQFGSLIMNLARLNSKFETGIKSPLDAAILEQPEAPEAAAYTKIDEVPFDFERRRLSIVVAEQGERCLIAKGAPESLLACAVAYSSGAGDVPLTDEARRRYLGDGINDAPSLHAADVGISVSSAVDVARDAADIILLEPALHVLHRGVLEGRRAFGNVTKYLLMGTSSNFGDMFSMAGASVFLPFLPMLPTQVLQNNLLYDLPSSAGVNRPMDVKVAAPRRPARKPALATARPPGERGATNEKRVFSAN